MCGVEARWLQDTRDVDRGFTVEKRKRGLGWRERTYFFEGVEGGEDRDEGREGGC